MILVALSQFLKTLSLVGFDEMPEQFSIRELDVTHRDVGHTRLFRYSTKNASDMSGMIYITGLKPRNKLEAPADEKIIFTLHLEVYGKSYLRQMRGTQVDFDRWFHAFAQLHDGYNSPMEQAKSINALKSAISQLKDINQHFKKLDE